MGLLTNWKKKRELRSKIELIKAKASLLDAKNKQFTAKTRAKTNKYDRILNDMEAQKELANNLVDMYGKGELAQIMEMPFIQQLIQGFMLQQRAKESPTRSAGSSWDEGKPSPDVATNSKLDTDEQKAIKVYRSLPKPLQKQVMERIKQYA